MSCRVCNSNHFDLILDLHDQPCANLFVTKEQMQHEKRYPLRLVYCHQCRTAQLDYTVKKEVVYSEQNTYLSGMTKTLKEHFNLTAKNVDHAFFSNKTTKAVLDIGSNDGTQLESYQKLNYDVLGVEPCPNIAKIANEKKLKTLPVFFNDQTARNIGRKFDVINASGVFFHLEELHSVTDGIKLCLNDDGVFVVQFLYMKNIMENLAFDQIYHEHLLYYTLKTLNHLLNLHDLEIFDAYPSSIHGGSVIAYATHRNTRKPTTRLLEMVMQEEMSGLNELHSYQEFAAKIENLKNENLQYLRSKKAEGKKIYGLGAPVKGNTLLNYFGIDQSLIEVLVEKNPLRRNLFSPGKHIPVIIEDELKENPDVYYVLAWNFKKEILERYKSLIDKGVEFYFPINPKVFAC